MVHAVKSHNVGNTKYVRSCLQLSSERMLNTAAERTKKKATKKTARRVHSVLEINPRCRERFTQRAGLQKHQESDL